MTFDRLDGQDDMKDASNVLDVQITAEDNSHYLKSKFASEDRSSVPQIALSLIESGSIESQKNVMRLGLGMAGILDNASARETPLRGPGESAPGPNRMKMGEGALSEMGRLLSKLDAGYGKELMDRGDVERLHKLSLRKGPDGMAKLSQDLSNENVQVALTPDSMTVSRRKGGKDEIETVKVLFNKDGGIEQAQHVQRGWFTQSAKDLDKSEVQQVLQQLMRRSAK